EVLAITESNQSAMREVKALGRKVRNFEEKKWVENRERIVVEGNLEKFRQHKDLREKLDATGDAILVEASPMDKIWGIGLGEKSAKERGKAGWRGLNLLGKALVQVRETLREETQNSKRQKVSDNER